MRHLLRHVDRGRQGVGNKKITASDAPELRRRLQAMACVYGRRSFTDDAVSHWFVAVAGFRADIVWWALDTWDQAVMPVPVQIKSIVANETRRREYMREVRVESELQPERRPNSGNAIAFSAMWSAIKSGRARDVRDWCEGVVADASSDAALTKFARDQLSAIESIRPAAWHARNSGRKIVRVEGFKTPSESLMAMSQESDSQREARLEREAIQAFSGGG